MRFLSHALFAVLATTALIICATVVVGVFSLVGKPFIGFSVVEEGLVNPVGLQSWGGVPAGFRMWDRIIAVDGELVFSKDDVVAQAFERPVGSKIVYQVESEDGHVSFVELPTRVFTASDLVKNHSSLAMLGLVFVIVAVLLYFLRPATAEAWSFFGLFAALGIAMCSVVDLTLLWQLPPLFPIVGPFLGTLGIILVGVITRAYTSWDGARFVEGVPEAGETGFKVDDDAGRRPQRRMWGLTIACIAISTIIAVMLVLNKGDIHKYVIIDSLFYTWLFVQTALGLGLLALSYARGRSPRRRARIRQILWAWPVGAGVPMLNLFMGHVLQLSPMSMIWNGFLLLVPISTADAIVRHDLLRLNHTARRIVGGLTVAAVVGIALGLALWSAVQFLALNDAPAMVALAALLFAIAAPITHRVQTHVEDLLRSRRYDAGRLVAEFTTRASTSTHLPDVLAQLRTAFAASIGPASFELYRLERSTHRLTPQVGTRMVDVDATLEQWLNRAEPLVVDEDVPAPPSLRNVALAVRLAVANEPVGLLVVSARPEGTPYEDNDVSFVGALAGPLAAALVNTLAFEAVERLNRELEARVAARTAELERTNSELALMNARKDELVATISHDFRSPLAVIRQNVQTILRDLPRMERDDMMMFLEGISRQEDRLTALCTNLLDLARLKHKRAPQEPVDIADTARRLVGDLQVRAAAAGVTLACNVDEGIPTIVRGDPDRLGQVLQNLIDNALKFTQRGGRVDVRLALAPDGGRLAITVSDTGMGVPAEALPRLFEPFFQVPTNAHAGQGSGLGLAIVKAVVDAHGGEVRVDSRHDGANGAGTGTTFTVLLPVATDVGGVPPHARPSAAE